MTKLPKDSVLLRKHKQSLKELEAENE